LSLAGCVWACETPACASTRFSADRFCLGVVAACTLNTKSAPGAAISQFRPTWSSIRFNARVLAEGIRWLLNNR
jgi:hypothetical protein